ncbi:MAG: hypothetical protein AB7R89_01625 [Dehalococcoidia bacterium]
MWTPGGKRALTRRRFLGTAGSGTLALAVAAACSSDDGDGSGSRTTPQSTAVGQAATAAPTQAAGAAPTPEQAQAQANKLVGDVTDFRLLNDKGWAWQGGWVTFKLYPASFNGQKVYVVRTDASDKAFAEQEKLVFVPKLSGATRNTLHGEIYLVEKGATGQTAVVSTAPGQPDFTPLLRVNRLTWNGTPEMLDSAEKVKAAVGSGAAKLETTTTIVNYPFVKWPGGELLVDAKFEKALEGGPLVSAPDTNAMTVTFKLHQCYPESYYIITDTGAVPMAPMMNVVGAPKAADLTAAGATEKIYVFGNGIPGHAAMGFQPSIFASKAGEPSWSPMWEHVTAMWKQGTAPSLLTTEADILAKERANELQLFPGTPDTGGTSFVVNCSTPITAPNTFRAG